MIEPLFNLLYNHRPRLTITNVLYVAGDTRLRGGIQGRYRSRRQGPPEKVILGSEFNQLLTMALAHMKLLSRPSNSKICLTDL